MTSVSRSAIFSKIHKVLKKHYKPVAPPAERTVLEHLLFACVLEDAHYEPAEEAFAALKHTFYDWNEVRVTSISELSEVMAVLPDPRAAANRIKRVLHSIFEELYCFDLEETRKRNLGPTVKWLEKMDGTSKFVVAYVVQAALGGHSIPIDAGAMAALRVLDLVTEKDAAAAEVPGLERAVTKSKGVEFGSLLHQLATDYLANPFSPQVREILLAIDPEAAQRFPQRRQPRPAPPPAPPAAEAAPPPPATTGRKKKTESAAPAKSAAAEVKTAEGKATPVPTAQSKAAESKAAPTQTAESKADENKPAPTPTDESKTAELKPVESKKAVAAASKKGAEPAHESPLPEKQHDKPSKAEKAEKAEKRSKAENLEKVEKHEKQSAEASKAPLPSDGLGKRKPR